MEYHLPGLLIQMLFQRVSCWRLSDLCTSEKNKHLKVTRVAGFFDQRGSRNGAVVRALASHRSGLGSIPGHGVTCRLSLLLVLVLALRVFLWVLWLSFLHKNQHAKLKVAFDACMYEFLTCLALRG